MATYDYSQFYKTKSPTGYDIYKSGGQKLSYEEALPMFQSGFNAEFVPLGQNPAPTPAPSSTPQPSANATSMQKSVAQNAPAVNSTPAVNPAPAPVPAQQPSYNYNEYSIAQNPNPATGGQDIYKNGQVQTYDQMLPQFQSGFDASQIKNTYTPSEPTTPANDTLDLNAEYKKLQETTIKNQTESNAKIEGLLSKMGEDTTNATLAKYEEMQKGLQDSYKTYFDEQNKYLEEFKNQPSAVENLNKFREQQGLPQMEAQLAGVDKTIIDTEGLLANIEADIRKRTEGLPVSEAAARRLTAMEQKPLTKQMDELLRSRARVAAGLQAKQQNVQDFMNAQKEDLTKQQQIAEAKLGFAKDAFGFKKDIATQGFELFTTLQDSMNKINGMRIDQAISDRDYKNTLAQQGFSFFQQMQADKKVQENKNLDFQNELLKIKFTSDLQKENPDYNISTITDNNGNVSVISTNKQTGKSTVNNLGAIGEAKTQTDGMPTSYKEWELAGGLEGTGKTFAQWANPDKATVGTQAQQTVAEYASRLEQAEPTISTLQDNIKNMNFLNFEAQLKLPAALQSSEIQQYMQAGRNFINAKLRRESGAVIADTEFKEARQQYLPQPGDSDETLKLKKQNRDLVFASLKKAAGPAFSSVNELLNNQSSEDPLDLGVNDPLGLGFNQEGSDSANAQKIADAIKKVESGGNYNAKGSSGENGAYQFMPGTWAGWAEKYAGNANLAMTPENQDKVALAKINDLLNQGYNAKEIALIWNGGSPTIKKGVNSKGVAYDTGAYANKVLKSLG